MSNNEIPLKDGKILKFVSVMSAKDKSEVFWSLGFIQGLALGVENETIRDGILDAVHRIEAVIDALDDD